MRHVPIILATLIAALLCGCAVKTRHAPVVFDPPSRVADLAADLGAADTAPPADGYRLLAPAESVGRFTCDLAVAEFAWQPATGGGDAKLALVTPALDEQAYWSQRFRGVTQIRGLIFLTPTAVRLDGSGIPQLCAAAQRLQAALLIVYVRSGTGPNAADVSGIVYDTARAAALATIHAREAIVVQVKKDDNPDSPNELKGDYRNIDARYQVQRRFEDHAFACVRDLIHGDNPPPTTQPHDWQQPFVERWWIRSRR